MAEKSGFFDAHLVNGEYDRVYLAESFARYFASFIGNGIFGGKSNELMVRQKSSADMSVNILSGQAWINGYWYENDSDELSLAIDVADGVLNRIDAIVLRWNNSERVIRVAVKKGTPATNASTPVIERSADFYELKIAQIYVKAGATRITQADITDTRLNNEVCGFVHGLIEQFDTTEFGKQINSFIQNFEATSIAEMQAIFDRINSLIDDDMATRLALDAEETKARVTDIEQGSPAENDFHAKDSIVKLNAYEGAYLDVVANITPTQFGAGVPSVNNVRPFKEWETVNVCRTGKNLISVGNLAVRVQGVHTFDTMLPAGKYTLSALITSNDTNSTINQAHFIGEDENDKVIVYMSRNVRSSATFDVDFQIKSVIFYASEDTSTSQNDTATWADVQLEVGDVATLYEAYKGKSHPEWLFGRLVYGGTFNCTTGIFTSEWGRIIIDGNTEIVKSQEGFYVSVDTMLKSFDYTKGILCDKLPTAFKPQAPNNAYVSGYHDTNLVYPNQNWIYFSNGDTSATVESMKAWLTNNPLTVIYRLAEPEVYQANTEQIIAVQGENNIFCESGKVDVWYNHVSKTYVDANFASKSANGVVQSENADYAEVAEWSDGNPNGEDRIGYFVCVDIDTPGINIRKAGTFDNVRGVTMRNPAFSVNCTPDKFDENGNLLPQFNYVGFAGFIPVIDNGTCTIGSYCMPGEDGTAVPSINSYGYQVIERIDETHVLVLIEPGADGHVKMQNEMIKYVNEYAAPAGYGLGAEAKQLTSADDLNNNRENGWYWWSYKDKPQNAPSDSGTYYMNLMRVWTDGYGVNGSCCQEIIDTSDSSLRGGKIQRTLYGSTVYEWEWVNPPMLPGVEYRTTERYNGLPVYTKLVDFGAVPSNTYKSIDARNAGETKRVHIFDVRGIASIQDYGTVSLPYSEGASSVHCYGDNHRIILMSDAERSTWTAFMQVWYYKE